MTVKSKRQLSPFYYQFLLLLIGQYAKVKTISGSLDYCIVISTHSSYTAGTMADTQPNLEVNTELSGRATLNMDQSTPE